MKKIREAQEILKALGLEPKQQNKMSALTLLALANLGPRSKWGEAKNDSVTVTKSIMVFVANVYKKTYAPNTRETFRREVLHQFTQAGVTAHNPDNPSLPVNSPNAHYGLTKEALAVIRAYGTPKFSALSKRFISALEVRQALYKNKRDIKRIPLKLPDGRELLLSPGKHNEIEAAVILHFGPRFAKGADVLYLGDTEDKGIIFEEKKLRKLGCKIIDHGKLPDVILYLKEKKWLYLIEAVASHGPISQKRVNELKDIFPSKEFGIVFVTAFFDATEFKKHLNDIAWDTEVWLADAPDHLIHFNGDRFVGPR